MNILFKNCWVGCYVGSGEYEGGTCPDILITNVPENEDIEGLFDKYLEVLCDTSCQDKKEYDVRYSKLKNKQPVIITTKDDLVDCSEDYIQVNYNDLISWYLDEEISVDSQELVDFCNEDWSENEVTILDVINICEESIEDRQGSDDLETLHFFEIILSYVNNVDFIKLKDKDDKNLYTYLGELVDKNSLEKLWSHIVGEIEIYKFELNSNNELVVRLNMTYDELKKEVEHRSIKKVNPFDVDWD